MKGVVACLILVLTIIVTGTSAGGRTLVLLDNLAIKETHSIFFKILQGMYLNKKIFIYRVNIYIYNKKKCFNQTTVTR